MQNTGQAQNISTHQPVGSAQPDLYAVSHQPGDIPLHAIPQSVSWREVLASMVVSYLGLAITALLLKLLFTGELFHGVALVFYLTSIAWVYDDAKGLGVKRGYLRGAFDRTLGQWVTGCCLCWVIMFPAYLAVRPAYQRIASGPDMPRFMTTSGSHGPMISPLNFILYACAAVIVAPIVLVIMGVGILGVASILFGA